LNRNLKRAGFNLIEVSIGMLLTSMLGLGVTQYMKKTNVTLRGTDISDDLRTSLNLVEKKLMDDIKQAAKVYPSCDTNQATSAATTTCSSLKIRGAFTPLPGVDQADVNALTTFALPANLTSAPSSLAKTSDALRIVQYDFSQTFDCRLNSSHTGGANPSTTAGTASGAERMWASWDACHSKLAVGKLYVLLQTFGPSSAPVAFGNIFQITTLTDAGVRPANNDIQIDLVSTSNLYNQPGGMGLSSYTSSARIYPVKLVEWAVGATGGLYRREIKPSSTDLTGYQAWTVIQGNVESLQFHTLTIGTDVTEHIRTMQYTADANTNGIEDIRGVLPWIVIKSNKPSQDGTTYDNPQTASAENDLYQRKDVKFFIQMKNF
jgi:hypothetical protein